AGAGAASLMLTRRHVEAPRHAEIASGDLPPVTSPPQSETKATRRPQTAQGGTSPTPTIVAIKAPGELPVASPPAKSDQPPALGTATTIDRLDAPAALPKGMLAFLRGLDLLGSFQSRNAIEALTQAIDADPQNADFYTARGAAYVVSEKM